VGSGMEACPLRSSDEDQQLTEAYVADAKGNRLDMICVDTMETDDVDLILRSKNMEGEDVIIYFNESAGCYMFEEELLTNENALRVSIGSAEESVKLKVVNNSAGTFTDIVKDDARPSAGTTQPGSNEPLQVISVKCQEVGDLEADVHYQFSVEFNREPSSSELAQLKWKWKIPNGYWQDCYGKDGKIAHGKSSAELSWNPNFIGSEVIVMAYMNSQDEKKSVTKKVVKANEIIIVVGSDSEGEAISQWLHGPDSGTHKEYGNKLRFGAQAVREVRENYTKENYLTVFIFTDGYNDEELNAFQAGILRYNSKGNIIRVNSVSQIIQHINFGNSLIPRASVKIGIVKIFSHGIPNSIEFGMYGKNDKGQRFNHDTANALREQSFDAQAEVWSFACRTGNYDSRINASSSSFSYGPNWMDDVQPDKSLAQRIADQLNVLVYAYLVRTDYSPTYAEGPDIAYRKEYIDIEDDMVDLSGRDLSGNLTYDKVLWNRRGAYAKPRAGTSPGGIPRTLYKFEKGSDPVPQ